MNLHVRKGDNVVVLAGKDKGKTGKIISSDPKSGRVVVDNLNIITKHVKPRGANQPGGINKVAGPIDASNVQIICPSCSKATRVAHAFEGDKKARVCKKCGASLDKAVKVEKKSAKKTEKKAKDADKKETAKKTTAKKTAKAETVDTAETADVSEN